MGETNFHFFSCSLNGKMALDILGIRMELGHGMSYLHPWAASASKQKQKKKQKETHPTKQKHLRWFSGLDLSGKEILFLCSAGILLSNFLFTAESLKFAGPVVIPWSWVFKNLEFVSSVYS